MAMWFYVWSPFTLNRHPAKLGTMYLAEEMLRYKFFM